MKVIVYAGGEYVTGDEIALALLDYGEALAESGGAGSVEIPILAADGSLSSATFLVGPSSQIVASHVEFAGDELVDDASVARLRRLTRRLHPTAFVSDDGYNAVDDYDSE